MKSMKLSLLVLVLVASNVAAAGEVEAGRPFDLDLAVARQAAAEDSESAHRTMMENVKNDRSPASESDAEPLVLTLGDVL